MTDKNDAILREINNYKPDYLLRVVLDAIRGRIDGWTAFKAGNPHAACRIMEAEACARIVSAT